MNKSYFSVPLTFIILSSLLLLLGMYVLATKTSFHPQFFITACGEAIKNIQEHVHFNLGGVVTTLVIFVSTISASLTFWQAKRFFVSHRRLQRLKTIRVLPKKLEKIILKHELPSNSIAVVENNKLTAYTIGIYRPKIVISKSLVTKLSQDQLEAVVLHEFYHFSSQHVLWLLLSRLVSSLFFFIPLMGYLARQLKTEFELAADAFVIKKQNTRDHLRSSLALNIQYVGGVIPHFSTSPIETRVESLMEHKVSLEKIGAKQLGISLLSFSLMIGMAVTQPNQVVAASIGEIGGVCSDTENCITTDCSGKKTANAHKFTPITPASF